MLFFLLVPGNSFTSLRGRGERKRIIRGSWAGKSRSRKPPVSWESPGRPSGIYGAG